MEQSRKAAIFKASRSVGEYLLFSIAWMVCRLTRIRSASSCWETPFIVRNTLSLFVMAGAVIMLEEQVLETQIKEQQNTEQLEYHKMEVGQSINAERGD